MGVLTTRLAGARGGDTLLLLYWQLYSMKLKEVIKTPLDDAAEQQGTRRRRWRRAC